jgi:hypothetical protein
MSDKQKRQRIWNLKRKIWKATVAMANATTESAIEYYDMLIANYEQAIKRTATL